MAYSATSWVNLTTPALNATNLNKLTDELKSQALAVSPTITNTLPTWANTPSTTTPVSSGALWNELERVTQLVAQALSLTYTKTTWSDNWTPARNATNLNKLEQQAVANRAAIDAAGSAWSGPITISAGGTYTGNWESLSSSTSPVTINTTSPVTITNSKIRNLTSQPNQSLGQLIRCAVTGVRLTVTNTFFYGGVVRCIQFANGNTLTVQNCTIDKTTGIALNNSTGTVIIEKCDVSNIQGIPIASGGYSSQFVQFITHTGTANFVRWNQVVNVFQQSYVEDVISIFQTSNVTVENNCLRGGYPANVGDGRSGYGIILGDYGGSNNIAQDNQIIATNGGIGIAGGTGNIARRNRLIDDHALDNGTFLGAQDGVGIYAYSNPTAESGAVVQDNVAGWMSIVGGTRTRNDYYLPAGYGTTATNNTSLGGSITFATEEAEFNSWLSKLSANGITIGAT